MAVPLNCAIAAFHFTAQFSSHECITTLAVEVPSAFTPNNVLTEIAAIFSSSSARPFALANISAGWSWTETSVLVNKSGSLFADSQAGLGTGTGGWDSPSINTTLKVAKVTGLAGRAFRGIMMVPPFGLDESTDIDNGGNIDPSIVTTQTGRYQAARTQLVSDTVFPILIHADGTHTRLTAFACRNRVGTIRRRIK